MDDPTATVQMGTGTLGFHAQVLTPRGDWYVDRREDGRYVAYRAADAGAAAQDFIKREPIPTAASKVRTSGEISGFGSPLPRSSGAQLRTYRLALAVTGEGAIRLSGGGTVNVNTVHASLVQALTRINGIFQREFAVKLELIANNDALISLNTADDGYPDGADAADLLNPNATKVNAVIGAANYDIGHVFSVGYDGMAYLAVLGNDALKAKGATLGSPPSGESFYVDMVAHEMGHQLNGPHSFAGTLGSCSGNGSAANAVEPGSGSTIMAYAGICEGDNVQGLSNDYFHGKSYASIRGHIEAVPGVGTASSTGNSVPVVTPSAAAHTIPPRTPFRLRATGTDADAGDALTYTWEQMDGGVLQALFTEPRTAGAAFRSRAPGASGDQYFPPLASVLAGTTSQASGSCVGFTGSRKVACFSDFLPGVARTLNFRVTVRDNAAGGGGVSSADTAVNVTGTTPFAVTSHGSAAALTAGSATELTWDTAGTESAPYNTPLVDVLATTDGGTTWTTLANDVPNDGTESVTLPSVVSPAGNTRLMVRAEGNAFYDVNDAGLTLQGGAAVTGVVLSPASATVNLGGTLQLAAGVQPAHAANVAVVWSSSDGTVATVSSSGRVAAIAPGSATVTATTVDGGFTASSLVTVPLPSATPTPLPAAPAPAAPVPTAPHLAAAATQAPGGGSPAPAPLPARQISPAAPATPATIATWAKMTVPPGAKVKLTVPKSQAKTCAVRGGRVVATGNGTCTVTIAVTVKGTTKKRTVAVPVRKK